MATAAERLANNMNFGALGRATELRNRLLFTLGALIVFRLGTFLPIPGINPIALQQFFEQQSSGILGIFDTFSGGALGRMGIFALGVMPYISSSIIMTLMQGSIPYMKSLKEQGSKGQRQLRQITRYVTVLIAALQGYGVSIGLESMQTAYGNIVIDPGLFFRITTVVTLVGGTIFLMWLGEQITEKGVGNGISLIIFAGIVAGLPIIVGNTYSSYANQEMDLFRVLMLCVVCIAITAGVVFVEQGARRIPVEYAKRQVGRKIYGGQRSHLPIRVNTAGVIPAIFASSLLQFPVTIAALAPSGPIANWINAVMIRGGWLWNGVNAALIIFFAFFYTSITFRPDDVAENLKKHGGYIPGIRPGARTSDFIEKILMRLTLVGGVYLAAVCVFPTILANRFGVQFAFGGTSLLIVVGVALETFRQIEAHRQSLRYDSYVKKGTVRPRRGW